MSILKLTAVLTLTLISSSTGTNLVKIAFHDPHTILSRTQDSSMYWQQLADFGANVTIGAADSTSTRNSAGIQNIGQDNRLNIRDSSGTIRSLEAILSAAHYVDAQVENSGDTLWGYTVVSTGGVDYTEGSDEGFIYRPGTDQTGYVIDTYGWKWTTKKPCEPIPALPGYCFPKALRVFVRAKVWKHGQGGTILRVDTYYTRDSLGHCISATNIDSYGESDFSPSGTWTELRGALFQPVPNSCTWSNGTKQGDFSMDVKIYWSGADSVAIDYIRCMNESARVLVTSTSQNLDTAFTSYYNRIATSGQLRFYPRDEPFGPHWYGYGQFKAAGQRNGVGHSSVTAMNYNLALWQREMSPEEFLTDYYFLRNPTDTASTGSSSLQLRLDQMAAFIGPQSRAAHNYGKPFWFLTQAAGHFDANGATPLGDMRDPTPLEMKVLAYLPFCFGASGIGYFTYSSEYSGGTPPSSPPAEVEEPAQSVAPPISEEDLSGVYLEWRGLVDWDVANQRYVPNAKWDTAKQVNRVLDSLWRTVQNLQWDSCADWRSARSVTNGILDSIYSSTFDASATFLQVARFHSGSDEYVMLLNRRTLSSDGQNVVLRQNNRPGLTTFHDVYRDSAFQVYDSLGTVKFTTHFAPGELKFFRVSHIQNFKGTWAGTWPQYATIKVVGDVTVAAGQTLTVRTPVSVKAFNDSLHTGLSSSKAEFIVNGTLRLEGSAANRITLQPDQSGDSAWYGIRTTGTGRLYADNIYVKKAYAGLSLGSADTVKNSRIEDCFMYGVYSEGAAFTLDHDTLWSNNTTVFDDSVIYGMRYGIYTGDFSDAPATVRHGLFQNVKYPINVASGEMVIAQCDFQRTGPYQTTGRGTPAITVGINTMLDTIVGCHIWDYKYGLKFARNAEVYIVGSTIGSQTFYSALQPYMYIGIKGDSAQYSTCKVRTTCIGPVEQHAVYRRWTLFDLGTSSDYGHNNFIADTQEAQGGGYHIRPNTIVYNVGGATVNARGNGWDPLYTGSLSNYLYGPVDTLNAYHALDNNCTGPVGGEAKLAVQPAVAPVPVDTFAVAQNYPNPFNPTTDIAFTLPTPSHVTVEVFNVLGQRVRLLTDEDLAAGEHVAHWDGQTAAGQPAASGIYLYRAVAGGHTITKKMMLLK